MAGTYPALATARNHALQYAITSFDPDEPDTPSRSIHTLVPLGKPTLSALAAAALPCASPSGRVGDQPASSTCWIGNSASPAERIADASPFERSPGPSPTASER